ncbi:MAG: hypothetical protein HQL31_11830 [Planctomycetes bacterium]|nr:hypothetical protein [Planctomycetota bacterium]
MPISLVDLMPTLLGLTGTPIPQEVQGLDLSWHPLGQKGIAPESSYINYVITGSAQRHSPWRGVVTERYTYAATRDGAWLLYDDIEDPFQMNNLAGDSASEALRGQLHGMVQEWLAKTDDDFPDSFTMAERHMKGRHIGCAMPEAPLEPVIRDGQELRKHLSY